VASYRELLKQLEALQTQIDVAREQEVAAAIEKVRAIVGEYSLTPEQAFTQHKGRRGSKKRTVSPQT
jgi:DNA-binding protein H-NS